MTQTQQQQIINPHFDHQRVIWKDEYSGEYQPVPYDEQFDHQWELFLKKQVGFCRHTGVETTDPYIDDRIHELTGTAHYLEQQRFGALFPLVRWWRRRFGDADQRRAVGGQLQLEPKFSVDAFQGKRCLDVGCGAGRWTRTLKALGATVKSVDVSPHGLESTRRFNDDVEPLNLFDIRDSRQDLHEAFDFTLCWGVVMCTHDPKVAFENVAATVKPGGELYTMTYAPTFHSSPWVLEKREHYHRKLSSMEQRLQYAYEIADSPENAINLLDMLNTFYNWTVEQDTIHAWYEQCGFSDVVTLNAHEEHKCAYHVLGRRNG